MKCVIDEEPMYGRAIAMIEDMTLGRPTWEDTIMENYPTFGDPGNRVAPMHVTCFLKVFDELCKQEITTLFQLVIANVEDLIAGLEVNE